MIQHKTLNVKLSNSQLNKSESGIKNNNKLYKFLEMLLVFLMMEIIFHISCN